MARNMPQATHTISVEASMGTLLQDLRFALRQLRKAPSFAVTAVLTLALGVGANTAIFSIVNSLVLKPLPVENPQQIATLALGQNHGPILPFFSWPEYKEIRAQSRHSFSDVAVNGSGLDGFAMQGQQPQRIMTAYVSGNFFETFGLRPAAGRLFLRSEGETFGSDPVLVLSYDFWKEKFNADPNVVGRQATVDGHPFSIIGVAPKGFHGVQTLVTPAAYLPTSQLSIEGGTADALNNWQSRQFAVYGRLRPGVSLKQASAELNVIAQAITRQQPEAEKNLALAAFPEPAMRLATGDPNTMYLIAALFLSLAGMVLLLACVNVANLVLVRATVREREMAIRSALGAQRSRLIAQMITESITLALIGGVMGVALGMWASTALSHINLHTDLPVSLSFQFDWRIFLYSFAVALLAGAVVGLVPALRIRKANLNTVLREGGRGVARGHHRLRDTLVALQIAASLVLLVVTALFLRSLTAMQTMDFGFQPDHVLNLAVDANELGMTDAQAHRLADNILTNLHQLPGVDAVSHANTVPFGYMGNSSITLLIDGAPAPTDATGFGAGYNLVSPEYFRVMHIDLLRGRSFSTSDDEHSQDVAVISESTAKKYWPHQDPIGRTFRITDEKDRKLEVIGIARDVEFQIFAGAKSRPYIYLPYAQHFQGQTLMIFQLKTDGDPLALVPAAEKTVHALAPQLPIFQVQTMRQGLYTLTGLLLFQIGASLAAVMGALGLVLAVIGLYGVVSYAASQRVHEIGLRMALGASRSAVFTMIYRQSIPIIAAGLGVGLAVALVAARAVGSFVIVSVWDPSTYVAVACVLTAAALASCYLPARRAMVLEPMVALRED
jgi:predicted permease